MLRESELDFQHVLMATGLAQTLVAVPWDQSCLSLPWHTAPRST